jgi:PEGA domain
MTEGPLDPSFTPISPNPYIVGNPVRGRAMFFGREAEFELVRRRFEHSGRGGLMVFCGERRSGKTSILFQILDGRLGPTFIPALIDMQSMAVGNELDFLVRVSGQVRTALGQEADGISSPAFGGDTSNSTTFQKFIWGVLENHPGKKLILLFDEYELFENKIDAHLLSPDVLSILANLIENHPVFLVFTGSQHLEQRRRDYWKIFLPKSQYKLISFLERDDALNLIRKPVEGRVRFEDGVVESIWRLAAGQPFYTQAICQSLVDQLNERRTGQATGEVLADVVDGLVNNPLPQMIFLWDGLERDEKLVLALLAEQLGDPSAQAGGDELVRLLRRRQYPLDLDKAHIETTLEKLFKHEMLLRRDVGNEREYAFRMDLWRLWIRRQHSVWQVMREEGLQIRPVGGRRLRMAIAMAGGLALLLIAFFAPALFRGRGNGDHRPPDPAGQGANVVFTVSPREATISLNGLQVGVGGFQGVVGAGQKLVFLFRAPGYADSEIVMKMTSGGSSRGDIALRQRTGDLRIETLPSGAEVTVDGRRGGRSPVTLRGLQTARPHEITATLPGHGQARGEWAVIPDTLTAVTLRLEVGTTSVMVTTEPVGGNIRLDGEPWRKSPTTLAHVTLGRHTFSAVRDGYQAAETTLTVTPESNAIELALVPEPLGVLEVKGDRPAEIWIDNALAVANVQHCKRELPAGTHQVKVAFPDGGTIDRAVMIKSGERVTYDYSRSANTGAEPR